MSAVGELERKTQDRIIDLFQGNLDYDYLGNWEYEPRSSNIEEKLLLQNLKARDYDHEVAKRAIYKFKREASNQSRSLYENNKEVYKLLRYGVKVRPDVGENTVTVWLVDWANPDANHFALAEEVTVVGKHNKRPDLVFYLNGIAIGVLELKRSTVSIGEGIRQNLDNQQPHFIESFFSTVQIIMAGNDTQGMRYGVIETPEKYHLTWKDDPEVSDEVCDKVRSIANDKQEKFDQHLIQMWQKDRLIDLLHNFIVFDKGVKKICRHNQFYGTKAAQQNVNNHEGGIIWHTQGSGKSLTMVWLARWIKENIDNSRVLIVTDRDELDKQIEGVFKGVDEQIYRTKSCNDLLEKLNDYNPWLLCSLIHKFGPQEETDYEAYINEIRENLATEFADFSPKGNLFVFVDEAHRSQSGKLHAAMKEVLSDDSLFIGFTGTPLLKQDKKTTYEVFGPLIHSYKFDEGVEDEIILDLRYEARDIEQEISSQEKVDQWFEAKTKGLTKYAKAQLKEKWGTMQSVLSAQSRLQKIVNDVLLDMQTKDRLESGRGNALLVAGSIYQACKYYELFQDAGFKKCAIVTSYDPSISSIKGETVSNEEKTKELKQYEVYQEMLDGQDPEVFEEEVKDKFVNEPGQMKLLIVVDKLLTGFDAPPATYLYIDKTMRDHGLFQAICRVNRLDTEDKEYGFVIDYKDLFKSLEKAVADYTSEAFEDYDKEDVQGLLKDRLQQGKERLENKWEQVKALCEPVAEPRDTNDYLDYFCGDTDDPESLKQTEGARLALYKSVGSFVRAYANLANEMNEAGFSDEETEEIKKEVKHYEQVRAEVKIASGDYVDLKAYEPAMRHLIDSYIDAEESKVLSTFDDLTLIDLLVQKGPEAIEDLPEGIQQSQDSVAETIENNVRRKIVEKAPTNPKYFEKMSVLLDELIDERKAQAKSYKQYLEEIIDLSKKVKDQSRGGKYPKPIDTDAKRALYDNLDNDKDLVLRVDRAVRSSRMDGFRGNLQKEREIMRALYKVLRDKGEVEEVFQLVKNQAEY